MVHKMTEKNITFQKMQLTFQCCVRFWEYFSARKPYTMYNFDFPGTTVALSLLDTSALSV